MHANFKIIFISVKNVFGIIRGIVLNLSITLDRLDILTILLICEHGIFIYLCLLKFISSIPYNFQYRDLSSVKFILKKYFSVLDAIINRIIFLISLSDISLVYISTTYFYTVDFVLCTFMKTVLVVVVVCVYGVLSVFYV